MSVRRITARRVGITELPERIEVSAPFGPRENKAIVEILQTAGADAQASDLEGRAAGIGALLERLGYPATLACYLVDPSTGDWVLTDFESYRDLPRWQAQVQERGWAEARTLRHPALVWCVDEPRSERRAAQAFAQALDMIAQAECCASRGEFRDALRFAFEAGDLRRQALVILGWEQEALRGEKDARVRREGAAVRNTASKAKAAANRAEWRSYAHEIWAGRKGLSAKRVAEYVANRIKDNSGETVSPNTVRKAIADLKPGARKLAEP